MFNDIKLKLPDINHQIIKNIIREKRWLTPVNGYIYSILEPDNNKLNLEKVLSAYEQSILDILEINYESLKTKLVKQHFQYIYAIDNEDCQIYYSTSITKFGTVLYSKDKHKLVNRKTIKKKLDTDTNYAGYIWYSNIDLDNYKNYTITNLD